MRQLRNQYEDERRKTMSNERTVSQLQNDNRNLTNNIRDLQRELDQFCETDEVVRH